MNMQLQLSHSLQTYLEEKTGITSLIMYDGVTLPDEKPFITIKHMDVNYLQISKRKETMSAGYGFRLGVYENSHHERTETQEAISDLLLFDDIPIYDEDGRRTGGTFGVEMDAVVPLDAEDVSNNTYTHRVYFDFNIQKTKHKNRGRNNK